MRYLKQITILVLGLMIATASQAQILVMEGEQNNLRNVTTDNGDLNNVLFHESQNDQTNFTPLGDGIMLLAALGGAYLVGKRKNKKSK